MLGKVKDLFNKNVLGITNARVLLLVAWVVCVALTMTHGLWLFLFGNLFGSIVQMLLTLVSYVLLLSSAQSIDRKNNNCDGCSGCE